MAPQRHRATGDARAAPHYRRDLVVGLGELLWDVYPDGKRLGGAPCNFAYHASALGSDAGLATRVGNDAFGRQALESLRRSSISCEDVQVDPHAPTATTRVRLTKDGEPSFTMPPEVAWDHLEWTAAWRALAGRADVVCYGSLALRSEQSRATVQQFLEATRHDALRVFDVNVRHAVAAPEPLTGFMHRADVVKLNEPQAARLADALELRGGDIVTRMQDLRARHDLTVVCLTRGKRGSVLVTATDLVEHQGYEATTVDTTGAGDAFTAAFVHWYRRGAALHAAADAANRLAAWVTTQLGAMPPPNRALIADLANVPDAANSPETGP